ncbi:pentapeptide repeat-containing protein [Nocardia miyunensis]|uniref:pentapeptide repeat-containing protein n=1 Tax=Nocardia miyunensis TaxID=282684 RepID=UPI00082D8E6D|nr:pentapeptide repeat-containing protein [Nocardia miyunensis]
MRWRGKERLTGRVQRSALLLSVVFAVLGGLGIAALAWWVLWILLGAKAQTPDQVDLTKIALSVAAGVGGAVALVVAYRKQRDGERGRFVELFGAAARQLGDADVAVRIAGVYAMAGVADEFSASSRRQQCVDVLCGYLRLPYEPESGADHLVQRTETVEEAGVKRELRYQLRQNDREVRRAVVDVIVAHVRASAEVSWSQCNFDFSGAVLEDSDFRYAVFAGEQTYFARAVFTGERATTFEHARFLGQYISFRSCVFRGGTTLFRDAEFAPAERAGAEIPGARIRFEGAVFDSPVSFDRAVFRGPAVIFGDVTFSGERTSFAETVFRTERTEFGGATFDGTAVRFERAEFDSARISFGRSRFYAGRVAFDGARFGVRSRWRRSPTLSVDFSAAEYHGAISFDDTVFDGREADFSLGDFFGEITFRRARFETQRTRFDTPKAWVGVRVDWDVDPTYKPSRITPETWPPAPAPPVAS